jgi:hypothetical protein
VESVTYNREFCLRTVPLLASGGICIVAQTL